MKRSSALAWDAFQAGQQVESTAVSDAVLKSWRRSRLSGVDPENVDFKTLDVPLDSAFIRAAKPVMLDVADQLLGSNTCLALADASGTVVWRWVSDRDLGRSLEGGPLFEGVHFNEEVVGTNGVGTAIETKRVATVVGPEHFARDLHDWACIAAPVIHPVTRRVCGAVNITCCADDVNQFLSVAIRSMAADIRSALHSAATVSQKQLLDAYLERRSRTLAPLVAINERIIISDELAWDHESTWQAVQATPPGARHVTTPHGTIARVWPVTGGTLADGVVLELDREALATTDQPIAISLSPLPDGDDRLSPLERAERDVIREALASHSGNKSRAAAELRISRRSLYDKIRRYRLRA